MKKLIKIRKRELKLIMLILFTSLFSYSVLGAFIDGFSQLRYGENFSINASVVNVMTANTSRIYITNGGLVGIGTLAPDVEFKVVGDVNVTGTVWSQGVNLTAGGGGTGGWTDDGDTVRLTTAGDNVGIGTTTAPEKLTVDGNGSVTGDLVLGGDLIGPESSEGSGASSLGWVKSTAGVILSVVTDWVGIGVSVPNSTLTVAGNITPNLNNTYSLGEVDLVWKDIYVGNDSLHIGGTTLSNEGGNLQWGGDSIVKAGSNLNLTNMNVSGTLIAENITSSNGASYLKIKSGNYTGDGGATQAITGMGFQPIYVRVWRRATGVASSMIYVEKNSFDGTESAAAAYGASEIYYYYYKDDMIISLDSDGFTVGDTHGTNTNGVLYGYLAYG